MITAMLLNFTLGYNEGIFRDISQNFMGCFHSNINSNIMQCSSKILSTLEQIQCISMFLFMRKWFLTYRKRSRKWFIFPIIVNQFLNGWIVTHIIHQNNKQTNIRSTNFMRKLRYTICWFNSSIILFKSQQLSASSELDDEMSDKLGQYSEELLCRLFLISMLCAWYYGLVSALKTSYLAFQFSKSTFMFWVIKWVRKEMKSKTIL